LASTRPAGIASRPFKAEHFEKLSKMRFPSVEPSRASRGRGRQGVLAATQVCAFHGTCRWSIHLWRLGVRGETALPWHVVAQHARDHFPNGSNAFGEIHLAMLASGTGDNEALTRCAQRLQRLASDGYLGALAALNWVAALDALGAGRQGEAERFFQEV
jgi:hypothetical protein